MVTGGLYTREKVSNMGCASGKKTYLSQELAEEALLGARIRYEFRPGNGPVAVYKCEHCGGYHLTSRGEVNPRLEAETRSGNLRREQEASYWLDKLNKRR